MRQYFHILSNLFLTSLLYNSSFSVSFRLFWKILSTSVEAGIEGVVFGELSATILLELRVSFSESILRTSQWC
jgi:hypothetical protein